MAWTQRSRLAGTITTAAVAVALSLPAIGQPGTGPQVEWERTIDLGPAEEALAMTPTADGGFAIVGWTGTGPNLGDDPKPAFLLKVDGEGHVAWSRTHGKGLHSSALAVVEMPEGGYAVAGWTREPNDGPSWNAHLVRTDPEGKLQWEATYPLLGHSLIVALSLTPGGFVLVGDTSDQSSSETFVQWVDREGAVLKWRLSARGDNANAVLGLEDGSVLVAGTLRSSQHGFLEKTHRGGEQAWSQEYAGPGVSGILCMERTVGDGLFLAGYTEAEADGSRSSAHVIRTDSGGQVLRESVIREEGRILIARAATKTADGGLIVTGFSSAANEDDATLAAKIDDAGRLVWLRRFQGAGDQYALGVALAPDGGPVFACTSWEPGVRRTRSNVVLIKLAADSGARQPFLRGDADGSGAVDLSDAVGTLNWLFRAGPAPGCLDAADMDDNSVVTITDAVFGLLYLFRGGNAPPAPGAVECGRDPTGDDLSCDSKADCE